MRRQERTYRTDNDTNLLQMEFLICILQNRTKQKQKTNALKSAVNKDQCNKKHGIIILLNDRFLHYIDIWIRK